MANKWYTIDHKEKKIYATVAKLKPSVIKEIKNYLALGYELVDVPKKVETKADKEAKAAANPYSKVNVEAFLKKEENKEYFKEYQARYNEQAGTNRKERQKDGSYKNKPDEPKFLNSGEPKKKGYANCIGWFREIFVYDTDKKDYVKVEKK